VNCHPFFNDNETPLTALKIERLHYLLQIFSVASRYFYEEYKLSLEDVLQIGVYCFQMPSVIPCVA
jgi:hypothetical protein